MYELRAGVHINYIVGYLYYKGLYIKAFLFCLKKHQGLIGVESSPMLNNVCLHL